MKFTKTIKIPAAEARELQEYIESNGKDKVETIKTYTAKFGDNGEGNIEVDIKVCEGDPPFVDAVLFQDNHELGCLEPEGDLLGEYCFYGFTKNHYTVILEVDNSQGT